MLSWEYSDLGEVSFQEVDHEICYYVNELLCFLVVSKIQTKT